MIDGSQPRSSSSRAELGLKLTRILRGGWGFVHPDAQGRPRIVRRGVARGWERLEARLRADRRYRLAERRWDSPIAADLARQSVAEWLDGIGADAELRADGARAARVLPGGSRGAVAARARRSVRRRRRAGPAHRCTASKAATIGWPTALAAPLGQRLQLDTELVAVSHRGRGVRASVKHGRQVAQLPCDYLVFALPATLLRRIPITPALPPQQHDALVRLKYGRATKTLLQFSQPFWRVPGRPRAFGSPLPWGAVWDGNEEQRGSPGILALLAGGGASDATRRAGHARRRRGAGAIARLARRPPGELVAAHQISWDDDPWARGGYAFFDPAFDPALRSWLAQPCGPLFFAGEHTSLRWQGYMNGAIESGRRAAAEVAAVHARTPTGTAK